MIPKFAQQLLHPISLWRHISIQIPAVGNAASWEMKWAIIGTQELT
jgi:hypothetical protein